MTRKNKNIKLAESHGAKVMPFNKLPKEARYAMIHYMAIDGEAWEASDDLVDSFEKGWKIKGCEYEKARALHKKALMSPASMKFYSDKYGNVKLGYGYIPTKELIKAVWERDDALQEWKEDGVDFKDYKQWYFSNGAKMPNHSRTNRWPSILGCTNNEVIQDGWHRFYSYIQMKCRNIPCLFYV